MKQILCYYCDKKGVHSVVYPDINPERQRDITVCETHLLPHQIQEIAFNEFEQAQSRYQDACSAVEKAKEERDKLLDLVYVEHEKFCSNMVKRK